VDYVIKFSSDIFADIGGACSKCGGEESCTLCFGGGI
jgi:hypothetical protein